MSNTNLTEVVSIIDSSSSMCFLTDETIAGFNKFLNEQKEIEGDVNFSLITFSSEYKYLYDNTPIQNVKDLTRKEYDPHGFTAMNDAIGMAIDTVGKRLSNIDDKDRPQKVIFLIITDGQENSSKEYTTEKVSKMVKHQQDVYSWEFIFLGANIDVKKTANVYGFKGSKSATYNQSMEGTKDLFRSMSTALATERCTSDVATYDLQSMVDKN